MMAELYGRETGYCKGKGGSMHIANFARAWSARTGSWRRHPAPDGHGARGAVLGNGRRRGVLLRRRRRRGRRLPRGHQHRGAWKLPVVFVCENNLYGASTGQMVMHAKPMWPAGPGATASRATVDGNDIFAVHEAASKAVARARAGKAPR